MPLVDSENLERRSALAPSRTSQPKRRTRMAIQENGDDDDDKMVLLNVHSGEKSVADLYVFFFKFVFYFILFE